MHHIGLVYTVLFYIELRLTFLVQVTGYNDLYTKSTAIVQ
jgi:hypothetical protein